MKVAALLLLFSLVFASMPADAFLAPYRSRYGDLWDALVDPFAIIEGFPSSISKDVEAVAFAKADWKETSDAHVITLDVPGINKDEIKIEVEERRILRISGERQKQEEKKEDEKWHRVERSVGKFVRQFRLPENADIEGVKASLNHGVLSVTVPKMTDQLPKAPRVIPILHSEEEKKVELK
eukprot:TRINITY_DN4028_c0_g1_i3.p1 TRINITY_DN4028_c0_g1~~TRINITY_DN4028_c0_g1_i3.p1  ORF type:complete len:181 (-),score=17.50 TRINITY_DN4028_c0_g1_i3:322-864(-)